MLQTALYDTHLALGAKMISFADFLMPAHYQGVTKEHHTVRNDVGVFDVSHMGEFFIEGPNALPLLQKICSNDISKLIVGKAQYNYLPNSTGGIIDDLIVYQLEQERYLLVVNASNIKKDWDWISEQNKNFDAQLTNISSEYSLLAVQGPKAIEAMQTLTSVALDKLPFYAHTTATFAGLDDILIATTGYTGSGGLELYILNKSVQKVWDAIMKAGKNYNIAPIGLVARDTLRIEMGYCLYGNEIDENQSPIEAGLGWVTRPQTNFINSESIAKQKIEGTNNRLIGFEMQERGVPRAGYEIFDLDGNKIGYVTSGTQSPSLGKGIGLGYVPKNNSSEGTLLRLHIRNKMLSIKIVSLPFYKKQR